MRLALIDEIRRAVGFDAYAWLLTDPETEVGCAPLADVPWLAELPRQIRFKYLTSVNRWTRLGGAVAALRAATADHREASLVWREMLTGYGVNDIASLVFRDRFGCWAFLQLWRIDSGAQFMGAEVEFLTEIAGLVTKALRRCQARAFDWLGRGSDRARCPRAVAGARGESPDARDGEVLRVLVPPDTDRQPIPAGAYNVAAQLLAVESSVDDHPPSARVHLAAGVWRTSRAARIGDTVPVDKRDIAVTIESASPAERLALYVRACGLSSREAELLGHLATGADTRHIAQMMFLSEHTVQDHLKSIFAKAGVRSRRTLLTRAVGH
ncbi:MAG: helix-turn-helix transcriptional regulator [Actinomycetota bacterium]|nr:helix-turn-helix transcriptional regulator [Actinomycetota bacterium]